MNSAHTTDFAAIGLRDHSPFAILTRPRATPKACTAPAKRGPKPKISKAQQSAIALESPEERMAKAIARAAACDVAKNTASTLDHTNVATGRRPGARHQ